MLIFQGVGLNQQPEKPVEEYHQLLVRSRIFKLEGLGCRPGCVTLLEAPLHQSRRWMPLVGCNNVGGWDFPVKLVGGGVRFPPKNHQPGFSVQYLVIIKKQPNTFAFHNATKSSRGGRWVVFFESFVFGCYLPGSFIDCTTRDVPIHFRAQGAQSASAWCWQENRKKKSTVLDHWKAPSVFKVRSLLASVEEQLLWSRNVFEPQELQTLQVQKRKKHLHILEVSNLLELFITKLLMVQCLTRGFWFFDILGIIF